MTVARPEIGELVKTVVELVDAVNSFEPTEPSILVSYTTSPGTDGVPVNFGVPTVTSPDMTINADGDLEFLTSGLYVIALDWVINADSDAVGYVSLRLDYNDLPQTNFSYWGNNQVFFTPISPNYSNSIIFTYPPDRFDAGNIITFQSIGSLSAGTYTLEANSMIFVTRLA